MKLSLKPGVLNAALVSQMVLANQIVAAVFEQFGYPTVITSGTDGVHPGAPVGDDLVGPHYVGKALDYRTTAQGIPAAMAIQITAALQEALGAQYFVLNEAVRAHIHVQFGLPKPRAARLPRGMARWLRDESSGT
jgi:hypothetical protein